jgi:arabinan endo-1,5-alpha-L-arabinosidase
MTNTIFFLSFLFSVFSCNNSPKKGEPDDSVLSVKYRNPVVQRSVPDPTVIRVSDGSFYLYGTEDVRNIPIYQSTDLVNWTYKATAFSDNTRPTFEPNGGLWAPDINYINGKYVLYYSMSVWGGEWTCGIGVSVADRPVGPFTDRGELIRSNVIDVQNSIDPNYVEDGDRKYLFWGSFRGIYGIELTDDGLQLREGSEKRQVAGTAYEAVYIHRRGNYYYMFASIGSCCEGLNSTYTLVVGRSSDLWGPYTDKQGKPMMQNNHETVISKSKDFVGVGHCSEIVRDDAGNDWILYHGYCMDNPQGRRQVFLDKIVWVNDWPTVAGGIPSTEADIPVF